MDIRAAMSEDEMTSQRLVGIRRRRRIKRVLLAVFIFVGVMSFWQISRRHSEIIQIGTIQNAAEHADRMSVVSDMTKGRSDLRTVDDVTRENTYNNTSRDNKTKEMETEDNDKVTQNPLNQITTKSNHPTNTSSSTGHFEGDVRAQEDSYEEYDNNFEFAPNEDSTNKNGDVEEDDRDPETPKIDDVNETSHDAVNNNLLNIHEDGKSTPVEQDKVEINNDEQEFGENNVNMEPSEKPNDVTGGKLKGSTLKEDRNNTVIKSKILQYNYSEPRYSVSKDGQFELIKYIVKKANVSFSQSLRHSPFSQNDKVYMTLLSQGDIREIYSIKHHQSLRLVAFDAPTVYHDVVPIESCPLCGAIKVPKDIHEILAYHVDRTLGIDRALPATGRKFNQEELDNLGFESANPDDVYPVMWFAKDLVHRGTFQKDQNSMQLSWKQYQDILAECQDTSHSTHVVNCTVINYADWSRMAVLDFVMQNHDRLDRYCCGYDTDQGEACFHNEILRELTSCDDFDHRFLVHILTSRSNPHELILLDNAGNMHRETEHLNYEIMKGIRTIPKTVMENVYSEDLKDRLVGSLKWDTVYWKNTDDDVIDNLVDTIVQRVEKLKSYIKKHNIMTV